MRTRLARSNIPFVAFSFDRTSLLPLHRQLYEHVRNAVLSVALIAGTKVPSSRSLAGDLKCSRNTVLRAYDQLFAEGYLEGKERSGIYVVRVLPEEYSKPARIHQALSHPATGLMMSLRGERLARMRPLQLSRHVPFEPSRPDISEFPFDIWTRLAASVWKSPPRVLAGQTDPAGYRPLREAIVDYLQGARMINCTVDQVIITTGSQHSSDLVARLLLDPADDVWVEDPGYAGIRAALQAAGANVVPIPMDDQGINVEYGRGKAAKAKLVAVAPSHQFPLGIVMSISRRLELLAHASESKMWILEDDYDSEFRYSGRPLAALHSLDNGERVIYAGTFSKVMFPALRLGYLVVPMRIAHDFARARSMLDLQSSILAQPIVSRFMVEGHFATHIRRMRNVYRERQLHLVKAVQEYLGEFLTAQPDETGLHILARFSPYLARCTTDRELSEKAIAAGIITPPLSDYYVDQRDGKAILLGYGAFSIEELDVALPKLRSLIHEITQEHGRHISLAGARSPKNAT